MNHADLQKLRRVGSLAAQRALRDLDVDTSRRVEIFDVIERERVWLMFQPLHHLYGAYRRIGDAAGIVIHNGHPFGLQRFTASHEFGHHQLGHEISLDYEEQVERVSANLPPDEVEAQAFAATFLMPVQLVNRALSGLALPRKPNQLTPEQAYLLSLEFGASYTATIVQLYALDRITRTNATKLQHEHPIEIKTRLALGSVLRMLERMSGS